MYGQGVGKVDVSPRPRDSVTHREPKSVNSTRSWAASTLPSRVPC